MWNTEKYRIDWRIPVSEEYVFDALNTVWVKISKPSIANYNILRNKT